MDAKDIERLIEAAKHCKSTEHDPCENCPVGDCAQCVANATLNTTDAAEAIVAIHDYYENLLIKQSEFYDRVNGQLIQDRRAERSRVIAEVREWAKAMEVSIDLGPEEVSMVHARLLKTKLDSMDKG